MALTAKQERFIAEYMIDLNATQAAIRAGYSPKTATEQASRLLTNVNVCEKVEDEQKKRAGKCGLDAEWVLRRLKDISDRCMQAEPVLIREGNKWVESGEYSFDSSGANKATELIGKHLSMFTDKIDVSGSTVIFRGEDKLED